MYFVAELPHELQAVAARVGMGLDAPELASVPDARDEGAVAVEPHIERRLAGLVAVRVPHRVRAALAARLDDVVDPPLLTPCSASQARNSLRTVYSDRGTAGNSRVNTRVSSGSRRRQRKTMSSRLPSENSSMISSQRRSGSSRAFAAVATFSRSRPTSIETSRRSISPSVKSTRVAPSGSIARPSGRGLPSIAEMHSGRPLPPSRNVASPFASITIGGGWPASEYQQLTGLRLEQHGRHRAEPGLLDLLRELVQTIQENGNAVDHEPQRSHRAPQLAHRSRRLNAVADDVTDRDEDTAVLALDHVEPVAADLELGAAG